MIVSPRQKRTRTAQYVGLVCYILFLGFPLIWMLSVSLKGPQELVNHALEGEALFDAPAASPGQTLAEVRIVHQPPDLAG